jgi:hypothetical protein
LSLLSRIFTAFVFLALPSCGKMRFADFGSAASSGPVTLIGSSTQRITISGQTSFPARSCAALNVRTEDAYANERPVDSTTSILLNTSGDGAFHSASDCSTASRTNSVTLNAGESHIPVYYYSNRGESAPVLSASAPATVLSTGTITVNPIPAPIQEIVIHGPRAGRVGTCTGPFTLQFRNADHLPELTTAPTQVDFALSLSTTLYSDAACTSSTTSITIPSSQHSAQFYLRSTQHQVETFTATSLTLGLSLSTQVSFSNRFTSFTQVAGMPNSYGYSDGNGLSEARFMSPGKLTNDGTHIYIIESLKRIRRYTPATHQVTTVVGNASDSVSSLNRDGYGPLLRTESGNFIKDFAADAAYVYFAYGPCIRRMDVSSLYVETIVGSCTTSGSSNGVGTAARLPYLEHMTLDPVLRRLYVANLSSVWKIELQTLAATLLAGDSSTAGDADGVAGSARFNLTQGGLLVRSNGKVILGEFSRLKELDPATLTVTTLQTSTYHQENMVAIGSTYYAFNSAQTEYLRSFTLDPYSSQNHFMNMTGASRDGPEGVGSITGARGLTAMGGNLYFAQSHNNQLRKVDLSTMTLSTVAGSTGFDYGGSTITDFRARASNILAHDGNVLYVSDRTNCNIRKVDTSSGVVSLIAGSTSVSWTPDRCVVADGIGTAARFSPEVGLGVVSGNFLYLSDGGRIRRVDLSSADLDVLTLAGSDTRNPATDATGASAILPNPGAMAVIGNDLFFADGFTIRKLDLTTLAVTTVAGSTTAGTQDGLGTAARFTWISGLLVFGVGAQLIVSDQFTIRTFDPMGGMVMTMVGQPSAPLVIDGPLPSATFANIRGLGFRNEMGSYYLYVDDHYGLREVDLDNGVVSSLNGTTHNTPALVDRNGPLHQSGTSPLGYFVNLPSLNDGALYLPTGQGIRKLQ